MMLADVFEIAVSNGPIIVKVTIANTNSVSIDEILNSSLIDEELMVLAGLFGGNGSGSGGVEAVGLIISSRGLSLTGHPQ